MTATGWTVVVLAKAPRAGRSKTRLIPAFGAGGAAELAAAALADTLAAVAAAPVAGRVLALDGGPVDDLPPGFAVTAQAAGGHAVRIAAALAGVPGPALLIGMDTPQITPELLDLPDPGQGPDAWLGPAEDGGWWALGLRDPRRWARRALAGVPMSTSRTGALQRQRLLDLGLTVRGLPLLRDVDEPADAHAVAAAAPGTRFAHRLAALVAAVPVAARHAP